MFLEEYKKHVTRLAKERMGEAVNNATNEHAAIVIAQMFKSAHSQISILTGKLNARLYGREEVVEEAKLFLAHSDHQLRILIEDADENISVAHPLLSALRGNTNVEIRFVPREVKAGYPYHFLVMDDDSYRFVPDKDQNAAVAAFGDRTGAEKMTEIFTLLWPKGLAIRDADRLKEALAEAV